MDLLDICLEAVSYDEVFSLMENKLSAYERNEIPDKYFGLPDKRKFPLNDETHVRKAIQFFKFAKTPEDKKTLAKNIRKAIKRLNLDIEFDK